MSQLISDTDVVKCAICGLEAEMLTSSHFKAKHDIAFKEYQEKFPDAPTVTLRKHTARRKSLSDSTKGRSAHNKGKSATPSQKRKQSETMKEKFASGEITHWNVGRKTPDDVIRKISESVSNIVYSDEQKFEMRLNQINAKRTSIENGWVSPLKGVPLTGTHLEKSIKAITLANKVKSEKSWNIVRTKCDEYNLEILSIDYVKSNRMHLKCKDCNTEFSFQSQIFRDSKQKNGKICPKCFPRDKGNSLGEVELFEFIKSIIPSAIANDRVALGSFGRELDIFLPEHSIAFEYDGLYYHSENVHSMSKNLRDKTTRANTLGIRLIHVFEDEWRFSKDIVKSRIKQILGVADIRLHARKLTIKEITSKERNEFLSEHHLQGKDISKIRYGAFKDNELVAVMTFKPTNFVKGGDGSIMELSRFAVKAGYHIPGVASRLFKAFSNDNPVSEVLSYADRRWSDGNLYKTLGFSFEGNTPPDYWYFLPNEGIRMHRSNFMKHKLHSVDDVGKTESQIMSDNGYYKIYDCGSSKWIWQASK